MFEQGHQYRAWINRADKEVSIDGECREYTDGILCLDVGGRYVFYPLNGGAVRYVEMIDQAAKKAKANDRVAYSADEDAKICAGNAHIKKGIA